MEPGLYLYCIVPACPAGRPDIAQGSLGTNSLKFISLSDVQALVEDVPLEEFWGENLKKNLADQKWLETKILRHNQVITEAAQKWTAIPMKFGTVFESEKSLQNILKEKEDKFKNLLEQLDGKEEWGVKVFCNINTLKEHLSRTNQNLKDIEAALKDKSAGAAFFLKRKKADLLSEASDKIINQYAIAIHEKLAELAVKCCLNKLQPREFTKKETEMILNGAYLILKEKIDMFKSKASDLQQTYAASGLELEMSGPWPAYSFVSMEGK